MFENLPDRLERSFKILKGEGRITEINVAETLKEIRRALIDADVNYKVAKTFTDEVKQKALGANVLTAVGAVSPGAVAIVAPIALGFAFRYQISPLLMGLMVVRAFWPGASAQDVAQAIAPG